MMGRIYGAEKQFNCHFSCFSVSKIEKIVFLVINYLSGVIEWRRARLASRTCRQGKLEGMSVTSCISITFFAK